MFTAPVRKHTGDRTAVHMRSPCAALSTSGIDQVEHTPMVWRREESLGAKGAEGGTHGCMRFPLRLTGDTS